jgi:hypothetical protein
VYSRFLRDLGDGTIPHVQIAGAPSDLIRVPDHLLCDAQEDLLQFVYGDFRRDPSTLSDPRRAILAPLNAVVADINRTLMEALPGTEH